MNAAAIADAYFAAMRAQDCAALLAIFADDGVIVWPDGTTLTGKAAIEAGYNRLFSMPSNNPSPGPLMLAEDRFSAEVHSKMPDGAERRTLNVFRTNDQGLIVRMDSYRQG